MIVLMHIRVGTSRTDYANAELHAAASAGDVKKGEALLQRPVGSKPSINFKDAEGNTPLMIASRTGHVAFVIMLLDNDADKEIVNTIGRTALMQASHYGKLEVVKVLVANGAVTTVKDKHGHTALDLAETGPPHTEGKYRDAYVAIIEFLANVGGESFEAFMGSQLRF
jgi:ankyrin repeat protein